MKQIIIQYNKPAMLSGSSIPLIPVFVTEFGGILEALLFKQIAFLSKPIYHNGENIIAARISYTRLQRHIPSFTRRWIITTISKLRDIGAIKVINTKRVNLLAIVGSYEFKTAEEDKSYPMMLVFPELLKKLSPLEAIALQQIHIRCANYGEEYWLAITCNQLQNRVFPFVSLATVKRTLHGLRKKELIYVRPFLGDEGSVNSYRVNYLKVAELIGALTPEMLPQQPTTQIH